MWEYVLYSMHNHGGRCQHIWKNYLEKHLSCFCLGRSFCKRPVLQIFWNYFERFISSLILRICRSFYYFTKVYFELTIEFFKKVRRHIIWKKISFLGRLYIDFFLIKTIVLSVTFHQTFAKIHSLILPIFFLTKPSSLKVY